MHTIDGGMKTEKKDELEINVPKIAKKEVIP